MQREPFKKIEDVAQDQLVNFQESVRLFPDVLQWAERVKEYISLSNLLENCPIREYTHLLHLANKSFIHSLIIQMQLHHFHSVAIERIGVDAIRQMAIIEVNVSDHARIWQDYNWRKINCANTKQIEDDYNRVFSRQARSHNYSRFLPDDLRDEVQSRWERCCDWGSHANFNTMILSVSYPDPMTEVFSFFDRIEAKPWDVGVGISLVVDTFFILARVAARIFEQHNQALLRSSAELDSIWDEWHAFKLQKAKEWHIDDYRNAVSANPK